MKNNLTKLSNNCYSFGEILRNNSTDNEILPEIIPIYDEMFKICLNEFTNSSELSMSFYNTVYINHKKLTLHLSFQRNNDTIVENFKYYDYRYFHSKKITN